MVAKQLWPAAVLLWLSGCGSGNVDVPAASEPAAAGFVGGDACTDCHREQAQAWQGSHHDLAMQPADASTVLGNFSNAAFAGSGLAARFFERDGEFLVETTGADGQLAEFPISYTYGVEPLQQYLIELDDGKLQALSVAWDSRPAAAGGQRWFHLYPDEQIDEQDPLHWTGAYQRWNTMCADCHSTDLHKAYAVETDSFATHWSDVNVGCEGCHGPGSLHAADPAQPMPALPAVARSWVFAPGESIARRTEQTTPEEPAVCAQCHSRRGQLTDDYVPGDALLDAYRPALLEPGLYHADGQIQDEVYVYGSFLQSAMAEAGVTCSDCHDPHTAELRADGNAVCAQCHLASTYDRTEHHRHPAGTGSAQCTSCHMREETYMVVDPRRDHSFRVPRPDLSDAIGSPNACNDCHDDQTADWAAARVAEWYPDGRHNEPHFGEVLHAARTWQADARPRLLALMANTDLPAIVRATAASALADRMTTDDATAVAELLDSNDPLLRATAIDALAGLDASRRVDLLQRFLTDDLLVLRTTSARALLDAREGLSARRQADLDRALDEYVQAQMFNGDRPEGLLNAAGVAIEQGQLAEAESLLTEALDRHPAFSALYVNLADVYRLTGREIEAEALLRDGIAIAPEDPALNLALAFTLVRAGRADQALDLFRAAAELAPEQPYYSYVLAIAESDAGNSGTALELLLATQAAYPGYPDALFALATMLRDRGDIAAAADYAQRLQALRPGDPSALALLRELEQL